MVGDASSNTNKNATTGLLNLDPDMNWVGGVECHLLNKYLPQCSGGNHVKGNHDKAEQKAASVASKVVKKQVTSDAGMFRSHQGDGIVTFVEMDDDLNYIDDVPNPQDPDNERMMEVESLEVLDDSDGLEQGATASNIVDLHNDKDLEKLSKEDREELLWKNPVLKTMLNQLLDERLKDIIPGGVINKGKKKQMVANKAKSAKGVIKCTNGVIKSPSDTTIYAPALNLRNEMGGKSSVVMSKVPENVYPLQGIRDRANDTEISQFLQLIRKEQNVNVGGHFNVVES